MDSRHVTDFPITKGSGAKSEDFISKKMPQEEEFNRLSHFPLQNFLDFW